MRGAPQPTEIWRPRDACSYAYLLGVFLGDGSVTRHPRTTRLTIALDTAYPGIVAETVAAVERAHPEGKVASSRVPDTACVRVTSYWQGWPAVFPQHGPGPKHERPIVLEGWQQEIVDRHPREFLRGLIHSDGCRTVNRFKTKLPSGRIAEYAYPRYFFSNLSADIRGLFCEYCDKLGIRWTQSNHRNISVSHRHGVAALDEFIGPKR